MPEIVYLNGEFVPSDQARLSVFDRGVLYGDGVFEGIRVYNRNIFRLREHIERLYSSAKYIMLPIPYSHEELTGIIVETCQRNNVEDGYIRLVLTRGVGDLGLNPFACKDPGLFVIASSVRLYPREYYEKGLPIVTAATRRFNSAALSGRVKSLNYLNNILAKIEAIHAGVPEALMLDPEGHIVECTGDNFFIVKGGEIFTPPTYQGALRGITRDAVIELARGAGITVREERLTLYEAYDADECFLTGTAAEVVPVVIIDQRPIGDGKPGPLTGKLIELFGTITAKDGVRY